MEGTEKEKEGNINVWERNIDQLPLTHPQLWTWPATQACALTGNRTNDPLVCRPALNPLSHMSQGYFTSLNLSFPICEMVIKIITYVGDIFNCHPIVVTASFLVPWVFSQKSMCLKLGGRNPDEFRLILVSHVSLASDSYLDRSGI